MGIDIFLPRTIIYVKDFEFEDGSKRNKYLIVLHREKGSVFFLHSLTTSQIKVPEDKIRHGCTNSEYFSFYMFGAQRAIGEDNFYFDLPTFIHFNYNVRENSIKDFQHFISNNLIQQVDLLTFSEYKRLAKCISGSRLIPRKTKKIFISLREKLKE